MNERIHGFAENIKSHENRELVPYNMVDANDGASCIRKHRATKKAHRAEAL